MRKFTETWNMKASREDKSNIARLAKRLNVNESEAVRRAVEQMLKSGNENKADTASKKAA